MKIRENLWTRDWEFMKPYGEQWAPQFQMMRNTYHSTYFIWSFSLFVMIPTIILTWLMPIISNSDQKNTIIYTLYLSKPNNSKVPPGFNQIKTCYTLDVLWCQPIKLIQVVSTSELHEYWWNDVDFIFFIHSI